MHGHGRNVRQGDEPLLGHRVPDMDRGPGDTAGRHRRREQHHAGAGQGAHAGDRHPPRPGRTAYGHHLADSIYYQAVTVAQEGAEISWQISFGTGMLALFILVAGSLLAGVIPAYRALSIKAVDAIREE